MALFPAYLKTAFIELAGIAEESACVTIIG
jgi:hypothetical protein